MKALHLPLAVIQLLVVSALFAQGPLTPPPGAPAPDMKTLQQIEPRIDLQNAPAAAVTTTDANWHFIITQPGSYYLSANLGVTKPNGIRINAAGVTLDLSGFEVSRASGSGGQGIEIAGTGNGATVRNGSIKGFAHGVRSSLQGFFYAYGCAFRDLAVSGCTSYGIFAGTGAVIEACRAHDNSGFAAIFAAAVSTLINCTASRNSSTYGISAGTGSTLTNCSASGNIAQTGIYVGPGSTLTNCSASQNSGCEYGIFAEAGSTLSNCSAYFNTSSSSTSAGIGTANGCTVSQSSSYVNTSTAATLTPTTGMGFDLGLRSTIKGCTATFNRGDGIKVSGGSVARENTCDGNGTSGDGAGIHATGSDNRIEGNNVTGNDRGIDVDAAGNIIIRNSASGNSTNFDLAANNVFGAIVNRSAPGSPAVSGNNAAASTGTTDPWANFTY